jgi:hypothetical protein
MRVVALVLTAVLAGTAALASGATLVSRDWKASGDGLLTFDPTTNFEWLDISQTLLNQFPGANDEARYQQVVAATALGGTFEGFRVAKTPDVLGLLASAGIVPEGMVVDRFANEVPASVLIALVGNNHTPASGGGRGGISAYIDERQGALRFGLLLTQATELTFGGRPYAFATVPSGKLAGAPANGVLLLREVPEPTGWLLLVAVCATWRRHVGY